MEKSPSGAGRRGHHFADVMDQVLSDGKITPGTTVDLARTENECWALFDVAGTLWHDGPRCQRAYLRCAKIDGHACEWPLCHLHSEKNALAFPNVECIDPTNGRV